MGQIFRDRLGCLEHNFKEEAEHRSLAERNKYKKWGVCRNVRIMSIGGGFAPSLTSRIIIKATTRLTHVEV